MKKPLFIAILCLSVFNCLAQDAYAPKQQQKQETDAVQPFLFTLNMLTADQQKWNIHYAGSYGERARGQFGYDGLAQQFGLKGYLGSRFTLYATAAVGFSNGGGVTSSQCALKKLSIKHVTSLTSSVVWATSTG